MKRSTIISGIIGGVALWLFSFIFYGISSIMDAHYTPEGLASMRTQEDVNVLLILVGYLIVGFFLALIYDGWAQGTHRFNKGLIFGAFFGILFGVGMNLIWYATGNMMLVSGHIIDGIFNIVMYALAGGIISFVYNKIEKETA